MSERPKLYVVRLADGTHHREPPPGHPDQRPACRGQVGARKFETEAAARAAIKQRNLRGAAVVPYWY